jgi:hypothetical protein
MTGPSVILGYAILTPAILATSIPYAAYLSTPLGREPGGEYLHISRTLKGYRLAYVGSWLKIISYVGAVRIWQMRWRLYHRVSRRSF